MREPTAPRYPPQATKPQPPNGGSALIAGTVEPPTPNAPACLRTARWHAWWRALLCAPGHTPGQDTQPTRSADGS